MTLLPMTPRAIAGPRSLNRDTVTSRAHPGRPPACYAVGLEKSNDRAASAPANLMVRRQGGDVGEVLAELEIDAGPFEEIGDIASLQGEGLAAVHGHGDRTG